MKKKCFKCSRTKELRLFYRHPQMGDGYLGKCKLCTKKDVWKRAHDPETREKVIAYDKLRAQNPERKKKRIEMQRKSRKEKSGKFRARAKLGRAVLSKRLERKPCEVCGNLKSEGHHPDYRKALAVRWLCSKHHKEIHYPQPL